MKPIFGCVLASACLLVVPSSAQSTPASGTLTGYFDGVSTASGTNQLVGWACAYKDTAALQVRVYANGDYPRGELVAVATADDPSEAAVAAPCGTSASHYRFEIPLSQALRKQFTGQSLYMLAVGPTGALHTLTNSGTFTMPAASSPTVCNVTGVATLKACMARISTFQELNFEDSVTCSGSECCGANGTALIDLDKQTYKVVAGNGHTLKRLGDQTACSAISMNDVNYIRLEQLSIDEDSAVAPCTPYETCANTISSQGGSNMLLDGVGVYHSKATAMEFWKANASGGSLAINDAVIADSGIIGLYVGNGTYKVADASRHVYVTNSTIAHTRTNGAAFQGVFGSAVGDNLFENNILINNHYNGLWIDSAGKPYDGGQLYMPNVSFMDVLNNTIADGYCAICDNPEVMGVELGAEGTITGVRLENNYIYDLFGYAFYLNLGGTVASSTLVEKNTAEAVTQFSTTEGQTTALSKAVISDNTVGNTTPSLDVGGRPNYAIYRLNYDGYHEEAVNPNERPGSTREAMMQLSEYPRLGASLKPIYRCFFAGSTINDFPSTDPECAGQGHFRNILGFSYDESFPGALPFYHCTDGVDHFVSWSASCEGQKVVGLLGYAVND